MNIPKIKQQPKISITFKKNPFNGPDNILKFEHNSIKKLDLIKIQKQKQFPNDLNKNVDISELLSKVEYGISENGNPILIKSNCNIKPILFIIKQAGKGKNYLIDLLGNVINKNSNGDYSYNYKNNKIILIKDFDVQNPSLRIYGERESITEISNQNSENETKEISYRVTNTKLNNYKNNEIKKNQQNKINNNNNTKNIYLKKKISCLNHKIGKNFFDSNFISSLNSNKKNDNKYKVRNSDDSNSYNTINILNEVLKKRNEQNQNKNFDDIDNNNLNLKYTKININNSNLNTLRSKHLRLHNPHFTISNNSITVNNNKKLIKSKPISTITTPIISPIISPKISSHNSRNISLKISKNPGKKILFKNKQKSISCTSVVKNQKPSFNSFNFRKNNSILNNILYSNSEYSSKLIDRKNNLINKKRIKQLINENNLGIKQENSYITLNDIDLKTYFLVNNKSNKAINNKNKSNFKEQNLAKQINSEKTIKNIYNNNITKNKTVNNFQCVILSDEANKMIQKYSKKSNKINYKNNKFITETLKTNENKNNKCFIVNKNEKPFINNNFFKIKNNKEKFFNRNNGFNSQKFLTPLNNSISIYFYTKNDKDECNKRNDLFLNDNDCIKIRNVKK